MKNGSIEFVAVIAEKFKCYIEPYVFYEYSVDYEDHGFASKPPANPSPRVRTQDPGPVQGKGEAQAREKRGQKAPQQDRGRREHDGLLRRQIRVDAGLHGRQQQDEDQLLELGGSFGAAGLSR